MRPALAAIAAAGFIAVWPLASAHGPETAQKKQGHGEVPVARQEPFGRAGDPAKVDRTIQVAMSDAMRYSPAEIRVKLGQTVKLVAVNKGAVLHEIVIGTREGLEEHAALMKKFPGMEHEDANMAHVKPGKREELVWQFNRPGEFLYACLLPGHFEAGMVGKIVVAP